MRVIKQGTVLEDAWQRLPTPAPALPLPAGDWIVPLDYWGCHREQLGAHNGRVAVCLNGADKLDDLLQVLDTFDLIALEFPKFTDGRGYSHARLLRTRHGYRGELRAVGEVLQDQLFFMQRCGIDSFELAHGKDADEVLQGLSGFSVKYQSSTDGAPPIYQLRRKQGRL